MEKYACFAIKSADSAQELSELAGRAYFLGKHVVVSLPKECKTNTEIINYLHSAVPNFSRLYEEKLGLATGSTPGAAARAAGSREGFGFIDWGA